MAAKRPGKKAPANAGAIDESTPDVGHGKWEFLVQLGQRGGSDYLAALRNAIESEEAIPSEALKPLAAALREFETKAPRSAQLTNFAKTLSLEGKRGRPRKDDARFMRAAYYWLFRLTNDDGIPMGARSDSETIAILEEYMDESKIRKAVRDFPSAETFVRGLLESGALASEIVSKPDGGE